MKYTLRRFTLHRFINVHNPVYYEFKNKNLSDRKGTDP